METQSINSQPSFSGKLLFIEKQVKGNIVSHEIQKYIPNLNDSDRAEAMRLIADKPYDIFIRKSDDVDGFYEVNANAKIENVLQKKQNHIASPVLLNGNNPDRLFSSVAEAMKKYEKIPQYKNDTKPEGFLTSVFNMLFKKG